MSRHHHSHQCCGSQKRIKPRQQMTQWPSASICARFAPWPNPSFSGTWYSSCPARSGPTVSASGWTPSWVGCVLGSPLPGLLRLIHSPLSGKQKTLQSNRTGDSLDLYILTMRCDCSSRSANGLFLGFSKANSASVRSSSFSTSGLFSPASDICDWAKAKASSIWPPLKVLWWACETDDTLVQ